VLVPERVWVFRGDCEGWDLKPLFGLGVGFGYQTVPPQLCVWLYMTVCWIQELYQREEQPQQLTVKTMYSCFYSLFLLVLVNFYLTEPVHSNKR